MRTRKKMVTGVLEKLRRRKQISKLTYDMSAKDLPELNFQIGEPIRMKPLPGDRTGRWRLGTCVQRVASRSYVVDVDGSLYRRNRVDLRVAEQPTPQTYESPTHDSPEVFNAPSPAGPSKQYRDKTTDISEGNNEDEIRQPHIPISSSVPNTPVRKQDSLLSTPSGTKQPSPGKIPVVLRSGRVSRPPDRLNL